MFYTEGLSEDQSYNSFGFVFEFIRKYGNSRILLPQGR